MILKSIPHREGCWATDYRTYCQAVGEPRFPDHIFGSEPRLPFGVGGGSLPGWRPPAMALPDMKPLDREAMEALASEMSQPNRKHLASLWLPLTEDGDRRKIGVCHLVYIREGFMIVHPEDTDIRDHIQSFQENVDVPASQECSVSVGTGRGKVLGAQRAVLVDLPWTAVAEFSHPLLLRGTAARAFSLIRFAVEGVEGRPTLKSVRDQADQWATSGTMEDDTLQDYLTGEEVAEAPDGDQATRPAEKEDAQELTEQLLGRIAELEKAMQNNPGPSAPAVPPGSGYQAPVPKHRGLFEPNQNTAPISNADWEKLHRLAGPPPMKQKDLRAPALKPLASSSARGSFCRRGEGSSGGAKFRQDVGIHADATAGPHANYAYGPVATKLRVDSEACEQQDDRSDHGSPVKRWGQRKRQFFRRKGLPSSGRLCPSLQRPSQTWRGDPSQCTARVGDATEPGGRQHHETIHGATCAFVGKQVALSRGDTDIGGVECCIRHWECRNAGFSGEDGNVCGADCFGPREDATSLAVDRLHGTKSSSVILKPPYTWTETFQPSCGSILGERQPCLSEGLGLCRVPDCQLGKAKETSDKRCRIRRSCPKEKGDKTPKRKGKGKRVRCRRNSEQHLIAREDSDCRVVSSAGSLPPISMGVCSDSTIVESAEGSFPVNNSRVVNINSLHPFCSEKLPSSCSDARFPPADPLPDFSIPDQVFKSETLINTICDSFLRCRTGLSHFVRQSLEPITCTVERKCASSLWPVPPPRWRWSGSLHLGPRRRRRRK